MESERRPETPRTRFRAFLDSGDRRWIVPSLAGAGLAHASFLVVTVLTSDQKAKFAEFPRSVWYGMLLFPPVLNVLCSWLNALLLRFSGRFLGGQATTREVFTALAWSVMPLALTAPLITAEAVALVRGAVNPVEAGGLAGYAGIAVESVYNVAMVMSLFRTVISVSEAQRFSKWRAAGNVALSILPFLALSLALGLAAGGAQG